MQHTSLRTAVIRTFLLALVSMCLFTFAARAGGDSYEITLNNKVLIRQALYEPFDLKNLDLSEAKATDKIYIRFLQCNEPGKVGKSRAISIRDTKGNIVKEWKFQDSDQKGNAMVISVGELLALQKNAADRLVVYYSAKGYEQPQKLAALMPRRNGRT